MIPGAHVIRYLESHNIPCALIGGVALSAHGIARSTLDTDVLVADAAVLEPAFWVELPESEGIEIRRGDTDDPLRGVVRLAAATEPVDVIVGHTPWTRRILARRIQVAVADGAIPVVDRADLVLLKLYAGGPQDLLDVRLLLAGTPTLHSEVEARLGEAPPAAVVQWRRLGSP